MKIRNSLKTVILKSTLTFSALIFIHACAPNSKSETADPIVKTDTVAKDRKLIDNCLFVAGSNASVIDLGPHELEVAQAKIEKNDFLKNFSSVNLSIPSKTIVNTFTDAFIQDIHKDAFCTFTSVCNSCTTTNCVKPVPALRFNYGLSDDGKTFILLYQPVCLSQQTVALGNVTYTIAFDSNVYYKYVASPTPTFVPINAGEEKCLTNYKELIRILKKAGSTVAEKYVEGTDTKSVIFTLHEIGALLKDNTSEYVSVYHANYTDDQNKNFHSIILAPKDVPEKFLGFKNKYANLSHMCPPSCNKLTFKLIATP